LLDSCLTLDTPYAWTSRGPKSGFRSVPRKSPVILSIAIMKFKKHNEVTTKRNMLKKYHFQNSGRRIHNNASHPTTPEKWNMNIVVRKLMSAMVATAWQNRAVKNMKNVGEDCWNRLLVFESWYLIPIEANSKLMRIK